MMDANNPYSDIPFPEPVCKKHPDRPATGIMAFRRCDECNADALANYADQRSTPSIRPQDERAPDGRNIMLDHQGFYRTSERERNDV